MEHNTWAPQSPDLSGYAPASPDLTDYKAPPETYNQTWAPQSPDIADLQDFGQQPPQLAASYDPGHAWTGQQQPLFDNQFLPSHQQFQQPQPYLQQPPQASFYPTPQYGELDPMPQTRAQNLYKQEDDAEWTPQPSPAKQPAARGRGIKSERSDLGAASSTSHRQKMDTGGVEVKTKFPTARIKRIMQADEDVGKVAQVTPIVVCEYCLSAAVKYPVLTTFTAKALELFMIRLITSSAGVARSKGSKRVLTTHMKAAVMQDDQFDNLREIVGKVPDAPTKAAKEEDDDEDSGNAAPKKRKKSTATGAKGKKRRNSDDDS